MESYKHIESWKNEEVFNKQLALNKRELEYPYPAHWDHFIEAVRSLEGKETPKTLLDVGCGVGAYKRLCEIHFPRLEYAGMDYSEDAIKIAQREWGGQWWTVGRYQDLTLEMVQEFDIIHAGAMLDVLPNGGEALEFIMGLKAKALIFGRMKLVDAESWYETYTAYDLIETYAFHHGIGEIHEVCNRYGYEPTFKGNRDSCTLLLRKV